MPLGTPAKISDVPINVRVAMALPSGKFDPDDLCADARRNGEQRDGREDCDSKTSGRFQLRNRSLEPLTKPQRSALTLRAPCYLVGTT